MSEPEDYRPGNRLFDERRAEARAHLDAADDQGLADPTRHGFFNRAYEDAGEDAARIPWADLQPHPLLVDFLKQEPVPPRGTSALDVGCGLGDNAEALAGHGFETTAFDLVEKAIDWSKQRFPATKVDYRTADLFNLPQDWRGAFDLVHECYTLQAITPRLHGTVLIALSDCVKPGGRIVIITRARDRHEPLLEPPWPLAREEFSALTSFGFRELDVFDGMVFDRGREKRHLRLIFERL